MIHQEYVDWDFFWKRVAQHPQFLQFLYRVHFKKYLKVLAPINLKEPKILELGAGTGTVSAALIRRFGGSATLVDNNLKAYSLYEKMIQDKQNLTYIEKDFFQLDLPAQYDLVFSDGLVEHFSDKNLILNLHKQFVKPKGYLLLFALNQNLFTAFLALGEKKMGYSAPIPLKALEQICRANDLTVVNTTSYFFEYGILCQKK